jgi:hypothetical protein
LRVRWSRNRPASDLFYDHHHKQISGSRSSKSLFLLRFRVDGRMRRTLETAAALLMKPKIIRW